jgi:predicted DNA primase small subunit
MVNFQPATKQQAVAYYTNCFRPVDLARIVGLTDFERREFGWTSFPDPADPSTKVFNRNRRFPNIKAFLDALPGITPHKLYYGAVYQRPWQRTIIGAPWAHNELHFDIDITGSELIRRGGMCECGNSNDKEDRKKVCPACFEIVREAGMFLLDTMEEDFGIREQDSMVYFSGTRGIHVHYPAVTKLGVNDKEDKKIRKNLINYLALVSEKETKDEETGDVDFLVDVGESVGSEPLRRRIDTLVYRWFFTKAPQQTASKARFSEFAINVAREKLSRGESMSAVIEELVSRKAVTARQIENARKVVLSYRYPRYDGTPTYDTKKVIKVPLSIDCSTGCIVSRINDLESFRLDDVDHVLNHVR